MRLGYLGPEGTFSHEALLASQPPGVHELVPLPTIYETLTATHDGTVDRSVVPIENALEGSVNVTLDALAAEQHEFAIVGEVVVAIEQSLIAREPLALDAIEAVLSHPQGHGQCAGYLREHLPRARVTAANSTAEAVRLVAESPQPWAAIANRLAADLYGATVLAAGIEDDPGNATRFVWVARAADADAAVAGLPAPNGWKTSLVFSGLGAEEAGWLVRCLSELAFRGVNLTRIESRPNRQGLGSYMFFIDVEGRVGDPTVDDGIAALRGRTQMLRVLGSFPAA